MGWSSAFIAALSGRALEPRYILERIDAYGSPGSAWSIGSHRGLGCSETALGVAGVQVQGATLSPRGWSCTIGGFSVEIVGHMLGAAVNLSKGTIVQLRCGFAGMDPGDFEPIAVGVVRALRGTAPRWTLVANDVYSAARQRLYRATTGTSVFTGTEASTTLTAVAAVGAGTYTVATTAGFEKEDTSATGGTAVGAIRVTPAAGGDPYYRLWSASGATTFTIHAPGTASVMGTSDIGAAIGDVVEEVAYLEGHPIDLARRILASNDRGNGIYDRLPATWGVGIPDDLLDHDDCNRWRDDVVVASSGTYQWEYPQRGEAADAYTWLSGLLSAAGLFLAVRQGRLTVRAAQPTFAYTGVYHSGLAITDDDIVSVDDYDAWDPEHDPEYAGIDCLGGGGSLTYGTAYTPQTSPHLAALHYVLSDRVFQNVSAICSDVVSRCSESATRVPERVTATCGGLRLAQLAVGDLADLSTIRVHSRVDGSAGFAGRQTLVVGVNPAWSGGTVQLALLVYPVGEYT